MCGQHKCNKMYAVKETNIMGAVILFTDAGATERSHVYCNCTSPGSIEWTVEHVAVNEADVVVAQVKHVKVPPRVSALLFIITVRDTAQINVRN